MPQKQPKRRRLWSNERSCVSLRPEYKDHVWSFDSVAERTSDGKSFQMFNIFDEYMREYLAIQVNRTIKTNDVIHTLTSLFIARGTPKFICPDNGLEFVAELPRIWLFNLGVAKAIVEPGSPWANGYIESFNGKFRDELLNREIFDTVVYAKVVTEHRRKQLYPAFWLF